MPRQPARCPGPRREGQHPAGQDNTDLRLPDARTARFVIPTHLTGPRPHRRREARRRLRRARPAGLRPGGHRSGSTRWRERLAVILIWHDGTVPGLTTSAGRCGPRPGSGLPGPAGQPAPGCSSRSTCPGPAAAPALESQPRAALQRPDGAADPTSAAAIGADPLGGAAPPLGRVTGQRPGAVRRVPHQPPPGDPSCW